jgi:DNA recombination protein RmuC
LFVPIEPAFGLAIQQDQKIFLDALDRNIVLVSPSTLLATMRTVAFIWRQEKQKKSVLEIARQSGMLYDKFCAFVEELKNIGYRLDQAQAAYKEALHKLSESPRHGDSLIGRAEKIRELGAKASKRLPKTLLDTSGEDREAAPPLIDEQ